jgi:hypothetical protein
MVALRWSEAEGEFIRHATDRGADWSEIDVLCRKLSSLLDCHDRDRFSTLLKYGPGTTR